MPDGHVVVVGAGLAGLVAAATIREYGVDVIVHELGDAPGGATAESAGWIWRYRDARTAAARAPSASPVVSQLVVDHLDTELAWLVEQGVAATATSTGRSETVGMRVDPQAAIDRLVERVGAGSIRTRSRRTELDAAAPTVLASGGYAGDLGRIARECAVAPDVADLWKRRPRSAAPGDGIDMGCAAGGRRVHADGDCLVRVTVAEQDAARDVLSAVSELLVPGVVLLGRDGEPIAEHAADDWSRARQLRLFQIEHGGGTLEIPDQLLDQRVHAGPIRDVLARLEASTSAVERLERGVRVHVRAGVTHTWCGLDIDRDARVIGAAGALFAAGCDASGSGHGGTASGLAQALVLGRRAGAAAARTVLERAE